MATIMNIISNSINLTKKATTATIDLAKDLKPYAPALGKQFAVNIVSGVAAGNGATSIITGIDKVQRHEKGAVKQIVGGASLVAIAATANTLANKQCQKEIEQISREQWAKYAREYQEEYPDCTWIADWVAKCEKAANMD